VTGDSSTGRATGSASVGGGAAFSSAARHAAAAALRADGACSCSGASGPGPVGIVPATGFRTALLVSRCSPAAALSSAACSASASAAALTAAAAAALRAAARRAAAFLAAADAASEFGGAVLPGAVLPGADLPVAAFGDDLFLAPAAGTAGVSAASAARWSGMASGRIVRTGKGFFPRATTVPRSMRRSSASR
jgi:hypothetical protein